MVNISLATKMLTIYTFTHISSKISAYRSDFDETKYKSFLIKDDELLEKYNEIWGRVTNSIKKEFDSEPVYNEKYLKAKIKSYNWKINTNFQNNRNTKRKFSIYLFINNFDRFCF